LHKRKKIHNTQEWKRQVQKQALTWAGCVQAAQMGTQTIIAEWETQCLRSKVETPVQAVQGMEQARVMTVRGS